jgi:hypothetical protein
MELGGGQHPKPPSCAIGADFNLPPSSLPPETTSQPDVGSSFSHHVESIAEPLLVALVQVRLLALHRNNLFGFGAPGVTFEKRGSPAYGRNAGGWKPTRQHKG